MALSAFADKNHVPQPDELENVLAETAALWTDLIASLRADFDPLAEDWGFAGEKWGWSLRLKHGNRAVLYMTPADGFFYVGFALGEKAVAAALEGDLPEAVMSAIENAKKFAEGRAVRLDVRNRDDLRSATRVALIKMAN